MSLMQLIKPHRKQNGSSKKETVSPSIDNVRKPQVVVAQEPPKPRYTTIVKIDRSVPIELDYNQKYLFPELQTVGPSSYDLADITLWQHYDQRKQAGWCQGYTVYRYLRDNDMLKSCLSLHDMHAIIKKGFDVYLETFGNVELAFWKSAIKDSFGGEVPILSLGLGRFQVQFRDFNDGRYANDWYADRYAPMIVS